MTETASWPSLCSATCPHGDADSGICAASTIPYRRRACAGTFKRSMFCILSGSGSFTQEFVITPKIEPERDDALKRGFDGATEGT